MINKFDILIKNFKYHRSARVAQEEQRRKTKRTKKEQKKNKKRTEKEQKENKGKAILGHWLLQVY